VEESDFEYDKKSLEEWRDKLDVCLGDWNEKGVINTEMAVYKWTNQIYMTKEEIEKLRPEQRLSVPKPPVMPDLRKAERIVIDKAEMKVQEIQEE
jgi:hypothetical protein